MSDLLVTQLPALQDNYIYFLKDEATGKTAIVDPGEAGPVLGHLGDAKLDYILCTHHHGDHVGGVDELREATGAKVVGYSGDAHRLPSPEITVEDGGTFRLGESVAKVFFIPGHTLGHVAFWFESARALFCGDTLFSLGCGRLFEGSASQMWASLSRLRSLPEATRVFCAHEYTQANAAFAVAVDPKNEALARRAARVTELRAEGRPTVPSILGEERLTNPFLRADDPDLQRAVGGLGDPVATFAKIRERKDNFRA
jgi:hydroxyacylglutathione hydrolase